MIMYRAICLQDDRTMFAEADPKAILAVGPGVYRAPNGQLCHKCGKCGEPKHAVPV
jgi:hypothetical protein